MLRAFVLTLGCLLAAVGAGCWFFGLRGPGLQALFLGVVFVAGVVFERWRYRKLEPAPDGRWQATGERFTDPQSGANVEVFYDPQTGERRYVSADSAQDTRT